jgi:hypothetical protein
MKLTLIVLGVLAAQLVGSLFIAKLIRVGRGPLSAHSSWEPDDSSPASSPASSQSAAAPQGTAGLAALAREVNAQALHSSAAPAVSKTPSLSA